MTHTWKIYDLERTIEDEVVTKITYACESADGSFSERKIGDLTITGSTDDEGFIAYADLTEETILGWVASGVDKSAIESELADSISNTKLLAEAVTTTTGLPWM